VAINFSFESFEVFQVQCAATNRTFEAGFVKGLLNGSHAF